MLQTNAVIQVNSHRVVLKKLLGKGKSGCSWLAESGAGKVVLKALHDEPSPYYQFDKSKLEHELDAYHSLKSLAIAIPMLIDSDEEHDLLLKEYIPGMVAGDAISADTINNKIIRQLAGMFDTARENDLNLDYFPMNFVITPENRLVYIDYEINPHTREWELWSQGIYYWLNTSGMKMFIKTGDPSFINNPAGSGIPIKSGLQERVRELKQLYKVQY